MDWYIDAFRNYAVFDGRSRRAAYWYFVLFNIIVAVVLAFIDMLLGTFSSSSNIGLLSGIYSLAVIIPTLAVAIRRLHDTDRSGWWILISLIPLIGSIVLLVFYVMDSTPGQIQVRPKPEGRYLESRLRAVFRRSWLPSGKDPSRKVAGAF
ncbi:MAG: DUF805 domain-containing protein [Rubrobacter sp.]|nr:DUF805 domain-containing protein [Rubrobacter sp.]